MQSTRVRLLVYILARSHTFPLRPSCDCTVCFVVSCAEHLVVLKPKIHCGAGTKLSAHPVRAALGPRTGERHTNSRLPSGVDFDESRLSSAYVCVPECALQYFVQSEWLQLKYNMERIRIYAEGQSGLRCIHPLWLEPENRIRFFIASIIKSHWCPPFISFTDLRHSTDSLFVTHTFFVQSSRLQHYFCVFMCSRNVS